MDVIPKLGIGSVTFGMHPAEVFQNFPEQQTYEAWMGGNLNDSLLFHGVIFGFDACNANGPLSNSRLSDITLFEREDARLFGQSIGNWSRDSLIEYFKSNHFQYEIQIGGSLNSQTFA